MPARRRYESGTPWEPKVGYSRAVRVGDQVFVSGTTATGADGELVAAGDPYGQAVQAIRNVAAALKALGCGLDDVVRTRIYVTRIDQWPEIARAHSEHFGGVRPACTLVQVNRLVDPEMLVEIEVDAIAGSGPERRGADDIMPG